MGHGRLMQTINISAFSSVFGVTIAARRCHMPPQTPRCAAHSALLVARAVETTSLCGCRNRTTGGAGRAARTACSRPPLPHASTAGIRSSRFAQQHRVDTPPKELNLPYGIRHDCASSGSPHVARVQHFSHAYCCWRGVASVRGSHTAPFYHYAAATYLPPTTLLP